MKASPYLRVLCFSKVSADMKEYSAAIRRPSLRNSLSVFQVEGQARKECFDCNG